MMCDGASLSLICRMYSPRSVSTGCTPAAVNAAFSWISSETIDLDFVTLRTSCFFAMSTISRVASSGDCAYRTTAPLARALRSNVSSQTSSRSSARLRRSTAALRVASKSSISVIAAARAVTNFSDSFFRFFCSRASASFCPARALKCIDCVCIRHLPRGPGRCAVRAWSYRRSAAAGLRYSACSPGRPAPPHRRRWHAHCRTFRRRSHPRYPRT